MKRELLWFLGTSVLAFAISLLFINIEGPLVDSTLDINIHDTYFVIQDVHAVSLLTIFVFFGIYLIRTLRAKFTNLTANWVLITSTVLLILALTELKSILEFFAHYTSNWTINPPPSTEEIQPIVEPQKSGFDTVVSLLFYVQIALLIFLVHCGYKTGQNSQRVK